MACFQQDEFVWLGLEVNGVRDLMQTLFLPTPHGTLLPWSDRGFFMALNEIFGLHALPFHIAVLVIQLANLALLGSLVERLTGSRVAGSLAPILWVVNPVLVLPMVWISGVYQVMGAFCFLLALRLFVAYATSGKNKYLFAQWGVFPLRDQVTGYYRMIPFLGIAGLAACAVAAVAGYIFVYLQGRRFRGSLVVRPQQTRRACVLRRQAGARAAPRSRDHPRRHRQ